MTRYEEVRELVKNDALKITDIAKQTGYNKGHISRLRKESKHQRDIQKNLSHILKEVGFPVENYSLLISKENWPVVKLFFAALWDSGFVEGQLAERKESRLQKVIADAVAAEREACAAVCCDMIDAEYKTGKVDHNEMAWTQACANAIRARSGT